MQLESRKRAVVPETGGLKKQQRNVLWHSSAIKSQNCTTAHAPEHPGRCGTCARVFTSPFLSLRTAREILDETVLYEFGKMMMDHVKNGEKRFAIDARSGRGKSSALNHIAARLTADYDEPGAVVLCAISG